MNPTGRRDLSPGERSAKDGSVQKWNARRLGNILGTSQVNRPQEAAQEAVGLTKGAFTAVRVSGSATKRHILRSLITACATRHCGIRQHVLALPVF